MDFNKKKDSLTRFRLNRDCQDCKQMKENDGSLI